MNQIYHNTLSYCTTRQIMETLMLPIIAYITKIVTQVTPLSILFQ